MVEVNRLLNFDRHRWKRITRIMIVWSVASSSMAVRMTTWISCITHCIAPISTPMTMTMWVGARNRTISIRIATTVTENTIAIITTQGRRKRRQCFVTPCRESQPSCSVTFFIRKLLTSLLWDVCTPIRRDVRFDVIEFIFQKTVDNVGEVVAQPEVWWWVSVRRRWIPASAFCVVCSSGLFLSAVFASVLFNIDTISKLHYSNSGNRCQCSLGARKHSIMNILIYASPKLQFKGQITLWRIETVHNNRIIQIRMYENNPSLVVWFFMRLPI